MNLRKIIFPQFSFTCNRAIFKKQLVKQTTENRKQCIYVRYNQIKKCCLYFVQMSLTRVVFCLDLVLRTNDGTLWYRFFSQFTGCCHLHLGPSCIIDALFKQSSKTASCTPVFVYAPPAPLLLMIHHLMITPRLV